MVSRAATGRVELATSLLSSAQRLRMAERRSKASYAYLATSFGDGRSPSPEIA